MERFSNEYLSLIKEVKKELFTLDMHAREECICMYAESPAFSKGYFSLFLLSDKLSKKYKLLKKSWDSEYDLDRFSSGIYNLDRLCIKTSIIELSEDQKKECKNILNNIKLLPKTLESDNYLLLDGTQYELSIEINNMHQKYSWKVPTQEINYFKPLIEFLTRM